MNKEGITLKIYLVVFSEKLGTNNHGDPLLEDHVETFEGLEKARKFYDYKLNHDNKTLYSISLCDPIQSTDYFN